MNATMLSKLKNTEVKVLKDRVNAFRLKDMITDFRPDILVSFGTWRNVLHDSIIDDDVSARPSQAERVSVQGRQTKIFNVGEDFLVAVSFSVLAQTAATYLTVGPDHYMWRHVARGVCPSMQFWVEAGECVNYYQGNGNLGNSGKLTKFVAHFWPSCPQVMPKLDENGRGSVVKLLSQHERVLVISAGRGEFWREIIQMVDQQPLRCRQPLMPFWGELHLEWLRTNGWSYEFDTPCGRAGCDGPDVCMRCLRQIKVWSCIREMKPVVRCHETCTQYDKADFFEADR